MRVRQVLALPHLLTYLTLYPPIPYSTSLAGDGGKGTGGSSVELNLKLLP